MTISELGFISDRHSKLDKNSAFNALPAKEVQKMALKAVRDDVYRYTVCFCVYYCILRTVYTVNI